MKLLLYCITGWWRIWTGDIERRRGKRSRKRATARRSIDLTSHEHERELKGAYRSFVIPGVPKTDIDSYFDQTKSYIETLI